MAEQLGLSELFQKGMEGQRKVESGEMSARSEDFKVCTSEAISALESATRMVNEVGLFSSNEEVDEIATTDLKYLLLPALLGDLTLQVMEGERLEVIKKARIYFVDYLQRCKSYAITTEDAPPPPSSAPGPSSGASASASSSSSSSSSSGRLEQMAVERATRIARLKEQKQMEKRLQELTQRLEKEEQSVDEELVREHTMTLLRSWVYRCQDHVRSVDQETELLEGMERMRAGQRGGAAPPPQPQRPPLKPVLITRDMLQSKVFGAGYPSLPTMTLEEFYERTYKDQVEQRKREEEEARARPRKSKVEEEDEGGGEKEEEEEEEESEESLKKARDWDDYKDDHRRGWGNVKNMG